MKEKEERDPLDCDALGERGRRRVALCFGRVRFAG